MQSENTTPLVSIGMPTYNEEKYLRFALESLLEQEYKNIEVIISDNASTDSTWDIIQTFMGHDSRISAVRHKDNMGASFNFFYVLEKAQGDYFMWAGGHDKWAPNMIDSCVNILTKNKGAILAAPNTVWIDGEDNILKNDNERIDTRTKKTPADRVMSMWTKMSRCNAFYGLYDTSMLRKIFPSSFNVIGYDFLFLLKIAAQGDVISCTDTCWYRRENRVEINHRETYGRQVQTLKVTGLAAKFPLLISRLYFFSEIVRFKGTLCGRLKLTVFSLRRLFLSKSERKLILEDVYLGFVRNKS